MKTTVAELCAKAPTLSVGMLTADLLHLGDDLEALDQVGVGIVHVDVMDGVFCPTMTVGPPIVKALPDRYVKDVHLMIDEPLRKVEHYVDAGAAILTFHIESTRHPHRVLQSLADADVIRGVALNPGTPLPTVEPLLDELELLLILAVNPGWGGQTFLPSTAARLAQARALLADREIVLAVDGGVTKANVEHIAAMGADLLVSGSAIYDGHTPAENARVMVDKVRSTTSSP